MKDTFRQLEGNFMVDVGTEVVLELVDFKEHFDAERCDEAQRKCAGTLVHIISYRDILAGENISGHLVVLMIWVRIDARTTW